MSVILQERASAFQNRINTYAIVNVDHIDLNQFLSESRPLFINKQEQLLHRHRFIKTYTIFIGEFKREKIDQDGTIHISYSTLNICTKTRVIDSDLNLVNWYNEYVSGLVRGSVEDFEISDSGWTLSSIIELQVHNSKYEPIRGSSYMILPDFISKKKAVINIQNLNDNKCFMWAILSALHANGNNAQRLSHYRQFENELNFSGLNFPIRIDDIKRFERLNPTISIHVYYITSEKAINPLRLASEIKANHIHLLYLSENENENDESSQNSHYCWIKNLSALLNSSTSMKQKLYICDRCLHYFKTDEKLLQHSENCRLQNTTAIEMPSDSTKMIKFDNYKNKLRVPFIVYADIESLLIPISATSSSFCASGSTLAYQSHEPFAIGIYFKSDLNLVDNYYKSDRGVNCIAWFAKQLREIYEKAKGIYEVYIPIQMTHDDCDQYERAVSCHICSQYFEADSVNIKVRDHCHFTGE